MITDRDGNEVPLITSAVTIPCWVYSNAEIDAIQPGDLIMGSGVQPTPWVRVTAIRERGDCVNFVDRFVRVQADDGIRYLLTAESIMMQDDYGKLPFWRLMEIEQEMQAAGERLRIVTTIAQAETPLEDFGAETASRLLREQLARTREAA